MNKSPHLRSVLIVGFSVVVLWGGAMSMPDTAAEEPDNSSTCGYACDSSGTSGSGMESGECETDCSRPQTGGVRPWPTLPTLPTFPTLPTLPTAPTSPPTPSLSPPTRLGTESPSPDSAPEEETSTPPTTAPGINLTTPGTSLTPPPANTQRNEAPDSMTSVPPPRSEVAPVPPAPTESPAPPPPPTTADVQTKAVVTDFRAWLLFAATLAGTFLMVRLARAYQQYRSRGEPAARFETRLDTAPFVVDRPEGSLPTRSIHLELRIPNEEES